MKIALGADHAGFELKERVKKLLLQQKHEVIDLGARGTESVDYPDFAEAVGLAVRDGKARRGILVCGSGIGASVAATRFEATGEAAVAEIRCRGSETIHGHHQSR